MRDPSQTAARGRGVRGRREHGMHSEDRARAAGRSARHDRIGVNFAVIWRTATDVWTSASSTPGTGECDFGAAGRTGEVFHGWIGRRAGDTLGSSGERTLGTGGASLQSGQTHQSIRARRGSISRSVSSGDVRRARIHGAEHGESFNRRGPQAISSSVPGAV